MIEARTQAASQEEKVRQQATVRAEACSKAMMSTAENEKDSLLVSSADRPNACNSLSLCKILQLLKLQTICSVRVSIRASMRVHRASSEMTS